MKTLKQLTLLVSILIQSITFSQTSNLESIFNKYETKLLEQNKDIAILIKKDSAIENTSIGDYKLSEQSVFNIGSATKTFTAILFLQEMEKGNLQLTDSIGSYLTPLKNVDGSLTLEDLLTHESGLDEVIGQNLEDVFYAKSDSLYNVNLLNQIGKSNPKKRGKFQYCNTNYLLLGKIIEKITDQQYFDLLRERFFIPLQMHNSYAYVSKSIENIVHPTHNGKDVSAYMDYRFYGSIPHAAGSIASTLLDMEVFYRALFETEKLLKKETLKRMLESGNDTYGYGIFKSEHNGETYYGHGGNNIGYAFRNEYNPVTKDLFLMFSNSISIPSGKLIKDDLIALLNNQTVTNFKSVDIENFKDCAGTYFLKEANLTLEIVHENDKMFIVAEAQNIKSELAQKTETSLYDTTLGVVLTKIEDNSNSLSFSQNGYKTTIDKVTPKK